ncbi:hypothetical protein ACHAXS_009931 [Conticribra weissflogii]
MSSAIPVHRTPPKVNSFDALHSGEWGPEMNSGNVKCNTSGSCIIILLEFYHLNTNVIARNLK